MSFKCVGLAVSRRPTAPPAHRRVAVQLEIQLARLAQGVVQHLRVPRAGKHMASLPCSSARAAGSAAPAAGSQAGWPTAHCSQPPSYPGQGPSSGVGRPHDAHHRLVLCGRMDRGDGGPLSSRRQRCAPPAAACQRRPPRARKRPPLTRICSRHSVEGRQAAHSKCGDHDGHPARGTRVAVGCISARRDVGWVGRWRGPARLPARR